MDVFSVSTDSLFITSASQSAQMEGIAQRLLVNALTSFTAKNYDQAIATFKQAIGLAPTSTTAINAYDYMARSYVQKGDNQSAIKAYQQSIKADPNQDATYTSLANIYYSQGNYNDALAQYRKAAQLNPSSANLYSLGQGYLAAGQYSSAANQFDALRGQEPTSPAGDFGLGLTYAKQGLTADALDSFQRAISIKADYWEAYSEMGYALANSGQFDKAREIISTLQDNASSKNNASYLAGTLNSYINQKQPPAMLAVYSSNNYAVFPTAVGPGAQLANLSSYLSNAGDQQTFAMIFQFSKQMDRNSIENTLNWSITRPGGTGQGDGYNYGLPTPATEVSLATHPAGVFYDSTNLTATVLFTITQNATADGTIDPSHIKFSFGGKDVFGLSMNSKADAYSGFSGFA